MNKKNMCAVVGTVIAAPIALMVAKKFADKVLTDKKNHENDGDSSTSADEESSKETSAE